MIGVMNLHRVDDYTVHVDTNCHIYDLYYLNDKAKGETCMPSSESRLPMVAVGWRAYVRLHGCLGMERERGRAGCDL
jgi:hypothetical protein